MSQFSSIVEQTVNPGESIIFEITNIPSPYGLVRHQQGTGSFLLEGLDNNSGRCCCNNQQSTNYFCDFSCNIAIPTGGTVEEISVVIAVDGNTLPATVMRTTPAAVEEFDNVSVATNIPIWDNCCQTVSVRNVSTQPILVQPAIINFELPNGSLYN